MCVGGVLEATGGIARPRRAEDMMVAQRMAGRRAPVNEFDEERRVFGMLTTRYQRCAHNASDCHADTMTAHRTLPGSLRPHSVAGIGKRAIGGSPRVG